MTVISYVWRLAILLLILLPISATAQAQTRLADAQEKYRTGAFDEAIVLYQDELASNRLSKAEEALAYQSLALAYMHEGRLTEARQAAADLLQRQPDFMPASTLAAPSQRFSDSFRKMIYGLRQELQMPIPRRVLIAQSAKPLTEVRDTWLVEAEEAYESGQHRQAADLIDEQLSTSELDVVEKAQAYRMQGLAYTADGKKRKAKQAATKMILIYPEYESEAYDDPQAFQYVVEETQDQYERGVFHERRRRAQRLKQGAYMVVGAAMTGLFVTAVMQEF